LFHHLFIKSIAMKLEFSLTQDPSTTVVANIDSLIIAGWAGRDIKAIEHHIEELAAIGVPRPSTVPLYYRVANNQLTQASHIQALGTESSGEVEVFVFTVDGTMYVSLASDHTDRKLEAYGVAESKQACVKPVATEAWRFDEVTEHWDQLVIRSWIEEEGKKVLYQEGTLDSLRLPQELIKGYTGNQSALPEGHGMICGTVGAIGGIRPSNTFVMELHDPVKNRSLQHTYHVDTLPVVA